jgi:ribonuclease HI
MDLMAAIQGLPALKEPYEVEITTDAEHVRQGIIEWDPQTNWTWTQGHAGDPDNNRCDW